MHDHTSPALHQPQNERAFRTGLPTRSRWLLPSAPAVRGRVLRLGASEDNTSAEGASTSLHPLTVPATLHTGGRTLRWNIARPDTEDPGFLGRAFRHLGDESL